MTTIAILLATYNGARFLPAQLQSIADQTCKDWHLYIRDDGSTDATPALLADFAEAHTDRVSIVQDDLGRLGSKANFNRLMEISTEPYIAFSDQDDIWRRAKLARARARLRALEAVSEADTPCMVHADRTLIDRNGRLIWNSYWDSRGLLPSDFSRPEAHYAFCLAAGSTMMVNRALLKLALPVPTAARMYDCWLELVGQVLGRVDRMDEVAVDHRRHGQNASGAGPDIDSIAARRLPARAMRLLEGLETHRNVWRIYLKQAAAFRARFGTGLSVGRRRRLDAFLSLPDRWLLGRLLALWQSRAAPPGLGRTLAFAFFVGGRRRSAVRRPRRWPEFRQLWKRPINPL